MNMHIHTHFVPTQNTQCTHCSPFGLYFCDVVSVVWSHKSGPADPRGYFKFQIFTPLPPAAPLARSRLVLYARVRAERCCFLSALVCCTYNNLMRIVRTRKERKKKRKKNLQKPFGGRRPLLRALRDNPLWKYPLYPAA